MLASKDFSLEPMLCDGAERLPEGPEWRYELKLDGYQVIGRKSGRTAQICSRNQKDFARLFPAVVKAIANLPDDSVIDGEIVAFNENGRPSFHLLQGFGRRAPLIVMYAFDLLTVWGKDARLWPLEERRHQLRQIVRQLLETVRFSETFNVPLTDLMREVKQLRLQGIVAKRAGSRYRSGERCSDWLKWRANRGHESVIGRYVPNCETVDSILVGYFEGCDLMYAARVRAGLPGEFQRVLLPYFQELQISRCPFRNLPDRSEGRWGDGLKAGKMVDCRWLEPFLAARIEFLEWTPEGLLRHPRFTGICSDKDARDIGRE